LIVVLVFIQLLQARGVIMLYETTGRIPAPLRWCGYLGLLFGLALLGRSTNEFIYFQF
jgi:hypothetical protein